MQSTFLSTYDQIKIEGKIEGKKEGMPEKSILVAEKILLQFPDWDNEKIADLSTAPLEEVVKIRLFLDKRSGISEKRNPFKSAR